jgi:hypothetical protein
MGKFSSLFFFCIVWSITSLYRWPSFFNIFVYDVPAKINNTKFLLFSDYLKMYRDIKSVEDRKSLQADM